MELVQNTTTTSNNMADEIINNPSSNQDTQDQANLPPIATKDMDVTFVQDVSGSMHDQRVSVVNGINEIIVDMKKRYRDPCEHRAHIHIIKFSSHDNIRVGERVPVHDVPIMDLNDLVCDGMTALWDAVAIAIDRMNTSSAGVPATTYVFSDGDNNDSRMHNQSGVNEMIADNKKRNPMHSILFIGSDPSTKRNAAGMGLDRMHSIHHDSHDTPVAYEVCRRALARCVSGDTQSTEFNDDDIQLSETPSHEQQQQQQPQQQPQPHIDSQLSDDYDFAVESDDVPSAMPTSAMPRRAMSSSR
jgi:Mg-chelatase subunit ChlD